MAWVYHRRSWRFEFFKLRLDLGLGELAWQTIGYRCPAGQLQAAAEKIAGGKHHANMYKPGWVKETQHQKQQISTHN